MSEQTNVHWLAYTQKTFIKPQLAEELVLHIWYHPKTKRILVQDTPLKTYCERCHMIRDDKWKYKHIDDVIPKLLSVGWREYAR